MPLPLPNLDDRDYTLLMREALNRIEASSPQWKDISPSDPGVVLLDIFAHLTDIMIHRLNRVPDKMHYAFLRLLGLTLYPPAAARATLHFTRKPGAKGPITIPRGTKVGTTGGKPPIFITLKELTLNEDETEGAVLALNCDTSKNELVGYGTGKPGHTVIVKKPPIIARVSDAGEVLVQVELPADNPGDAGRGKGEPTKRYQSWREVSNFSELNDANPYGYVLDRATGTIMFPPALYAPPVKASARKEAARQVAVPAKGCEIRVSYRYGGGPNGNVMAGRLLNLEGPLNARVEVTNHRAATGGRDGETLEEALLRAAQTLRTQDRAVTAEDYEMLALHANDLARARAVNAHKLWSYAPRGEVRVLIVPDVPEERRPAGAVTADLLREHETEETRLAVQKTLDEKRPMGTECRVSWASYKTVQARAQVIANRDENLDSLKARILERLNRTINPLPSRDHDKQGWAFGSPLRVSHLYDAILGEPGVRWVDNVELVVDEAPTEVSALAVDRRQINTWYAGSQHRLFRSLNGGEGWEVLAHFVAQPGESIKRIESHPDFAGLVAVMTYHISIGSKVYVSADCGERWNLIHQDTAQIEDMAWSRTPNQAPSLFLATDAGLFQRVDPLGDNTLDTVKVIPNRANAGFYAVATALYFAGRSYIIAAAQDKGGVYISSNGGKDFNPLPGLEGYDVRVLAPQSHDAHLYLWAGTYALGNADGDGCFCCELTQNSPWTQFSGGWQAGGCRELTFLGRDVFAATHRAGVLRLSPDSSTPVWDKPDDTAGLPVRDLEQGRFLTINTIASDPRTGYIMVGVMGSEDRKTGQGIYRTEQTAEPYNTWVYRFCSQRLFYDRVTLPETWLMVSGPHEIKVISEDER